MTNLKEAAEKQKEDNMEGIKPVQERDSLDLLELVCQLHSRAARQPGNKAMHDAYVIARQELDKRLTSPSPIQPEEQEGNEKESDREFKTWVENEAKGKMLCAADWLRKRIGENFWKFPQSYAQIEVFTIMKEYAEYAAQFKQPVDKIEEALHEVARRWHENTYEMIGKGSAFKSIDEILIEVKKEYCKPKTDKPK